MAKLQFGPRIRLMVDYFTYLIQRVNHDRLTVTAGSMAYVTLRIVLRRWLKPSRHTRSNHFRLVHGYGSVS